MIPSGKALWATSLDGTLNSIGNSITSDINGNIYVTGSFASNPLTINNYSSVDPDTDAINVTPFGTLSRFGSSNVFIVKYKS